MKTSVKSIRYKWTPDKMNNDKEPIPCVGCAEKCRFVLACSSYDFVVKGTK